jgi:hypothetical protein
VAQAVEGLLCKLEALSSSQSPTKQTKKESLVILVTFQVFCHDMGLVATVLDSADIEHFHHCRKFYWTALVQGTDPRLGTDENSKARLEASQPCSLPCCFPANKQSPALAATQGLWEKRDQRLTV